MKRFTLFAIFLFMLSFSSRSQVSCGTDFIQQADRNSIPGYSEAEQKRNNAVYNVLSRKYANPVKTESGTVYTVPIAVHIVHQNGPENVSDSFVIASVNNMNLRFQNAAPFYDSTGHTVNIQFCLASIDPQGNPTTGITRDTSALTNLWASLDADLKNISRWDPDYYYNIWVVNSIYGFPFSVVGYSSLPSNAGDTTDGVVIIGYQMNNNSLTHESGHYLGLHHTFGNFDCSNFNCLLEGDFVCDTPPDTTSLSFVCMGNSCSTDMDDTTGLSPFTSDATDLPNYMDYTTCPLSFSQGQADRMEASLVTLRSSMLQSFGCGFTGSLLPDAQMTWSVSPCNDGVVTFSDSLSTNVLTTNWDFENDGIYDAFNGNTFHIYPVTGTYTAKLLVAGPGGVDTVTQTFFVQKAPSSYYPVTVMNGVFVNLYGDSSTCSNFTVNFEGPPAVSWLWSTGDTTQSISFAPDSVFTIWLTIVDSNGLTWTNELCHPIRVSTSEPPPMPVIFTNDSTTICDGESVTFQAIVNGPGPYTYQWYQMGNSISGANDSTYTAIGFFPGMPYIVAISDSSWCYSVSDPVYVYSYAPPLPQSLTQNNFELISGWGSGNQWYMDGNPISGATNMTYTVTQPGCYSVAWYLSLAPACSTMSDTICFQVVSIPDVLSGSEDFLVFPNPAGEYVEINVSQKNSYAEVRIMNTIGEIVRVKIVSKNSDKLRLDLRDTPAGVYMIQWIGEKNVMNRKLLVE